MAKKVTPEMRARIRALRREGWSPEAITGATGVSVGRVRGILRDSYLIEPKPHMLAGYEPPDPEEEGLTPAQSRERLESRRAALLLRTEIEMTEDIVRRIVHTSDDYLEMDLELDPEGVRLVRAKAREWWERMRRADLERLYGGVSEG